MIKRFLYWLLTPKPKPDDYHLKCANCGQESVGEEGIVWVKYSDWSVEGRCCVCHGYTLYYKKDWLNLQAEPLNLKRRNK